MKFDLQSRNHENTETKNFSPAKRPTTPSIIIYMLPCFFFSRKCEDGVCSSVHELQIILPINQNSRPVFISIGGEYWIYHIAGKIGGT